MKFNKISLPRYLSLILIYQVLPAHAYKNEIIKQNWEKMQREYIVLTQNLVTNGTMQLENTYCHPHWKIFKEKFKQVVLGTVNRNFIKTEAIGNTMNRSGFGSWQAYETCYLKKCISPETKKLLNKFQESDFFEEPKACKELNCTANSLAYQFYIAKVLEQCKDKKLDMIVEFGGGYGNLIHIFKNIMPDATFVIIDLPELIALQYFFLSSTLPNTQVIVHSTVPSYYAPKAIHLMPCYLLENININADVFISTFALTEAPEVVQQIISDKKFFSAPVSYVCGQLDGWQENFVNQSFLHGTLRKCFKNIACHPFHTALHSYEITATN